MKTSKSRTYESACKLAAQLHKDGNSFYAIAKELTSKGFKTKTGKTAWHYDMAKKACIAGGGKVVVKPAAPAKTESVASSIDAIFPKDTAPRPLKRMISQTEWESMPEGLQQALIARILDRLG